MTATTFDALTAARDLESAGIERHQAEAIAKTMRDAAGADRAELVTKADLADFATKADLHREIAELRMETKADLHRAIGTLRSEVRWMFAFQGALILAITAKVFGFV